jgi:hypothetical protein
MRFKLRSVQRAENLSRFMVWEEFGIEQTATHEGVSVPNAVVINSQIRVTSSAVYYIRYILVYIRHTQDTSSVAKRRQARTIDT